MKIAIADAETSHAAIVADLVRRAFARVREDAPPEQSAELMAHLLGPANPAGRSVVAVAGEAGDSLGCLAAIPARFRRRDGPILTGYQVGYFFVDHRAQGRGVGSALVAALTDSLRSHSDSFVYTFPNPRSIARFDRAGYERVTSIPTYVYPPSPRAVARSLAVRGPDGRVWEVESIESAAAVESARDCAALAGAPGFVRDVEHFVWRYCGPGADERYRFALCRSLEAGERFIAVLAQRRMRGVPFAILVDLFSAAFRRHWSVAVRAAARRGGSLLVYANTNVARVENGARLPIGLPVPRRANPRPIDLLMLPGPALAGDELARSLFVTADWFGF